MKHKKAKNKKKKFRCGYTTKLSDAKQAKLAITHKYCSICGNIYDSREVIVIKDLEQLLPC